VTSVREATYGVLRDLGMTKIFGNPGSSELPFLKDMPGDFQYVLGLHERTAAGMALGYALARGEAAFVNLHSIASAGNGLSAFIDAYYCHAPLVVTTGQQDRRQVMAEPFLVSRAVEVVKPYVKWACEPLRPEDVPVAVILNEAVELASAFSTDDSGRFVNGVLGQVMLVTPQIRAAAQAVRDAGDS